MKGEIEKDQSIRTTYKYMAQKTKHKKTLIGGIRAVD